MGNLREVSASSIPQSSDGLEGFYKDIVGGREMKRLMKAEAINSDIKNLFGLFLPFLLPVRVFLFFHRYLAMQKMPLLI